MPDPVNWAGNVAFQAVRVVHPRSLDELRSLVGSSERVRAIGAGHSFSTVADTPGTLVRLDRMPLAVSVDPSAGTVTVPAGARYADIAARLHTAGLALANLASLPHITVAGAVATGTHGSGTGSLASAVTGLRLVGAGGQTHSVALGEADFPGAVVGLGALGIVTDLTLRVEPAYAVAQEVRLDVPLSEIAGSFDEVFGAAYSVSAFTSYVDGVASVFLKRRPDRAGTGWLGGRPADGQVHPIPTADPSACTPQLGVAGPWHERLPHFRAGAVPSAGDELQSEFLLPREHAGAALESLQGIASRLAPVLQISEIRTVAADDLWLSPAYGQDSVGFHFTWIRSAPAVLPVVALVESVLLPLGARPHWGKITTIDAAEIRSRYPRAADFAALRRRLDPVGTFANPFTTALFPA